jgi:hypothetical protein
MFVLHTIFDAGFSGEEALSTRGNLNVLSTALMDAVHKRALHRVLLAHGGVNKWIVVTDKKGFCVVVVARSHRHEGAVPGDERLPNYQAAQGDKAHP